MVVSAADPSGARVSFTVQVTVTDANDPPVWKSDPKSQTPENQIPVVHFWRVFDEDPGDTGNIRWSISGGDDQDKFTLVDVNGRQTFQFKVAPDFENPADADADNVYLVEITADDGNGGTAAQLTEITVTDVSEALIISGNPPTGVSFNTLYSFTPVAVDADGSDVSFEITGNPAWANFDPATGTLSGTPHWMMLVSTMALSSRQSAAMAMKPLWHHSAFTSPASISHPYSSLVIPLQFA